jgi:hypothetical protein
MPVHKYHIQQVHDLDTEKEGTTMDYIILSAYEKFHSHHRVSSDEILIVPHLRSEFLQLAHELDGSIEEEDALRCLVRLRKAKKLPRVR